MVVQVEGDKQGRHLINGAGSVESGVSTGWRSAHVPGEQVRSDPSRRSHASGSPPPTSVPPLQAVSPTRRRPNDVATREAAAHDADLELAAREAVTRTFRRVRPRGYSELRRARLSSPRSDDPGSFPLRGDARQHALTGPRRVRRNGKAASAVSARAGCPAACSPVPSAMPAGRARKPRRPPGGVALPGRPPRRTARRRRGRRRDDPRHAPRAATHDLDELVDGRRISRS